MKFWVYTIDWRSRAVNIIGEVTNEAAANKLIEERKDQDGKFFTSAWTPVSPEMDNSAQQFRRLGGKVVV